MAVGAAVCDGWPMDGLPERIETARLVLRAWTPDDVAALAAAVTRSIDHLRPWMAWIADEPLPRDARVARIEGWRAQREAGGDLVYGILAGDAVVGGCGFHRRLGPGALELGYWVHVDHVGRGVATEASAALTDAAFASDGIARVEIHHDRANAASGAVPRRLGFERGPDKARAPMAPADTGVDWTWAMSRERWLARAKADPAG